MDGVLKRRGASVIEAVIFFGVFGVIAAAGLIASFVLALLGLGDAVIVSVLVATGLVGALLGYCAAFPRLGGCA